MTSAAVATPFPQDVALVVVAYNSDADVVRLLGRLGAREVAVVDTGDDPGATASAVADRATYLDAGGNIGFARAANQGAAQVRADFVLFCNPDAKPSVVDVWALRRSLVQDGDLASVAPAVVDDAGNVRGGGGQQPSPLTALGTLVGPLLGRLWPARWRIWLVPRARAYDAAWLSGACLLVRSDAFGQVGGFDERYPLYNEDMALGARLARAGWRQRLDGRVRVGHPSGGSMPGGSALLWRWRGGALGHYVLHETRSPVRLTWSILLASFAIRAALGRVLGHSRWPEWWANAVGFRHARLPELRSGRSGDASRSAARANGAVA